VDGERTGIVVNQAEISTNDQSVGQRGHHGLMHPILKLRHPEKPAFPFWGAGFPGGRVLARQVYPSYRLKYSMHR
jgi:hypothetical protein